MSRAESMIRVVHALETGDFAKVTIDDLAASDNDTANRRYRQWLAGGRVPLPLHDPEEPNDCVDEVLVRISTGSGFDHRYRYVIEHHDPLNLQPGDLVYVRRARPLPDPEKRR